MFAIRAIGHVLILSLVCAGHGSPARAQTRVLKCVAADGSVSFVGAQSCPGDAQASERVISEHKVTLTPTEERRARELQDPAYAEQAAIRAQNLRTIEEIRRASGARNAPVADKRERQANPATISYQCSAAGGVWYKHSPCPATIGAQMVTAQDKDGISRDYQLEGTPVKQKVVTRSEACKEINGPRSQTRAGNQLDEITGPYDKLQGKDPCR